MNPRCNKRLSVGRNVSRDVPAILSTKNFRAAARALPKKSIPPTAVGG